jgi:hypothetical protein
LQEKKRAMRIELHRERVIEEDETFHVEIDAKGTLRFTWVVMGPETERLFGDFDLEEFTEVAPKIKRDLFEALSEDLTRDEPGAVVAETFSDQALLELVQRKFGHERGGIFSVRTWLKKNGIPHDSYYFR